MGRFTTKDSWQGKYNRPLSLNGWMYTEGNPVNYSDPSGHWIQPECSYDPSQNIDYIEKKAGVFLNKSNWIDTYTAAGIAVQCWAQIYDWKANDDYDGRGPAKITNAQAYTSWGQVINDADGGDPRGYGLLCYILKKSVSHYKTVASCTICENENYMNQYYGVGNYQLETTHDQTEMRWAVEYMRRTIKLITDVCDRERNCLETDKYIAAALVQEQGTF